MGRCERCRGPLDGVFGMSVHHRKPRGLGGGKGRPWINEPPNLLAICGSGTTGCHGWVESNRTIALHRGLLLLTGWLPEQTPFQSTDGAWWLLLGDAKHRLTLPTEDS
jgi:hypothetical protein